MPPKKSHIRPECEFRQAAEKLLADIRCLRETLAKKEQKLRQETIGFLSEAEEKGAHFEANILAYVSGLEELQNNYSRRVEVIAGKITKSIHLSRQVLSKKKSKHYRRDIWLELAGALECLGRRPSKKFAALLIDDNDRLVAWDVNHLCFGIEKSPYLYVKNGHGDRGRHILCAERNVIAKFLGIGAVMPASHEIGAIHEAVGKFIKILITAAIHNADLRKYTVVSSHYPCTHCADVMAPKNEETKHRDRTRTIKEIIAYWNEASEGALVGPTRDTPKSQKAIRNAGIQENLRRLAA